MKISRNERGKEKKWQKRNNGQNEYNAKKQKVKLWHLKCLVVVGLGRTVSYHI